MTPKEKAEELVNRYLKNEKFQFGFREVRKECALIAVDEILSDYKNYLLHENTEYKGLMYWKEVKQELEKL
jgi:hypothetical protein